MLRRLVIEGSGDDVPPGVSDVTAKALRRKPCRRQASADELGADIGRSLKL